MLLSDYRAIDNRYIIIIHILENITTRFGIFYKTSYEWCRKMSGEDSKEITNKYGENIKAVRKKLKLSQEEISTQIGITYRAYSSYERGDRNPSLEFLAALNKMYNVNLNYVITGVGEMFNAPKFEDVQDEITAKVESILKAKGLI